jgi:hypothetical protein
MQMTNAVGTTEYSDIQEYNLTRGISGSVTGIANCYLDDPGFSYVSSAPLPADAAWYQKKNVLPFIPDTVIREIVPYTDNIYDIRGSTRSAPIDIGAYEENDK